MYCNLGSQQTNQTFPKHKWKNNLPKPHGLNKVLLIYILFFWSNLPFLKSRTIFIDRKEDFSLLKRKISCCFAGACFDFYHQLFGYFFFFVHNDQCQILKCLSINYPKLTELQFCLMFLCYDTSQLRISNYIM